MKISSTQLTKQQYPKPVAAEMASASQEPTDTFAFSSGSFSGKEMFQTATLAVGSGVIGAIPVVGALSGIFATTVNQKDELGALIGLASAATNVAASGAVVLGGYSPYLLAVPAVLGAVSWGGYAYNQSTAS